MPLPSVRWAKETLLTTGGVFVVNAKLHIIINIINMVEPRRAVALRCVLPRLFIMLPFNFGNRFNIGGETRHPVSPWLVLPRKLLNNPPIIILQPQFDHGRKIQY